MDLQRRLHVELRRSAMDLLARREHSVAELRDKLRQRIPRMQARLQRALLAAVEDGVPAPLDAGPLGSDPGADASEAADPHSLDETFAALDVDARIDAVLTELRDDGLQSDERYVEARVRSGVQRGHGPLKIRASCSGSGVDSALLALHLEAEEDAWPERLDAVLERRFGAAAPADRREWSRRARFAASRGFPEPLVVRALGTPPSR